MTMDTEESLKEYLQLQLQHPAARPASGRWPARFDFVANAAPGVKEILTVGKLALRGRASSTTTSSSSTPPATGHVVGQLAAPEAINELVQVGLVRDQTELDARHPRRPGRRPAWSS